jgi:hypothetical protein
LRELISISWWKMTTLRKESGSSYLDMSRKVVDWERRLTELTRWLHAPAPAEAVEAVAPLVDVVERRTTRFEDLL